MKRISDEDAGSARARNIGRLALFSVPLTLGIAASVWIGVWMQAHYFLIDRGQEQRRGSYVGASDPQRAPYIVETPETNVKVDRVEIEDGEMTVWFHNPKGGKWVTDLQLHWKWFAPDHTALSEHWDNTHDLDGILELTPGEAGIVTEKNLKPDPRASGLKVWFQHN